METHEEAQSAARSSDKDFGVSSSKNLYLIFVCRYKIVVLFHITIFDSVPFMFFDLVLFFFILILLLFDYFFGFVLLMVEACFFSTYI